MSKLKFNCVLGKRAQNHNKTKMSLVTSEKGFYEFLISPGTEYTDLLLPNDEVPRSSWKYSEVNVITGKNVNVAVAYVTAKARLNYTST